MRNQHGHQRHRQEDRVEIGLGFAMGTRRLPAAVIRSVLLDFRRDTIVHHDVAVLEVRIDLADRLAGVGLDDFDAADVGALSAAGAIDLELVPFAKSGVGAQRDFDQTVAVTLVTMASTFGGCLALDSRSSCRGRTMRAPRRPSSDPWRVRACDCGAVPSR